MVASRAGLQRPLWWAYQRASAVKSLKSFPSHAPDGLPLPPPLLMIQVIGAADWPHFIRGGEEQAGMLREMLARYGVDLGDLDAILDFGCGCGRIARHWARLSGPRIHGSDYNPTLVAWCQQNLPFMEAARNQLAPPLTYEDAQFDFVYSASVFTHLPEPLQHAWIRELHRVIKPGGYLWFTTAGEKAAERDLTRFDRRRWWPAFQAGELVVTEQTMAGTNLCNAYHPRSWTETHLLGPGFTLVQFEPGESELHGYQDSYLVRRSEGEPPKRPT